MKYDVQVIGAGVSGSISALELAKHGKSVVITEEDDGIGIPRHCTGVISVRGLNESGVDYKRAIQNRLYGSHIIGPHNEEWTVRRKSIQAYVVDRVMLDEIYAEAAIEMGAKLQLNKRITAKKDYLAPVIVGADGANSTIARIEGFNPLSCVKGYQQVIESRDIANDHMVSVFLSHTLFPGFFGWMVPIEDGRAIAGFGVHAKASVSGRIKKLIEWSGIGKYKVEEEFGGLIPLGPRKGNSKGNVLLVGDAGGYAKATSGGGVYFSTLSAKTAAKCIVEGRIGDYDKEMEVYNRELRAHVHMRNIYNKSNDIIIGLVFRLGMLVGIPKHIENKGDIDYASSILRM